MPETNDLLGRTKSFALRIVRMVSALPRSAVADTLGRQVLRSGTSVGANYREAYRARSRAEFISKAGECLREIDETGYWLELLVESGIVDSNKLEPLQLECSELAAIFVTILKKAKAYPKEKS